MMLEAGTVAVVALSCAPHVGLSLAPPHSTRTEGFRADLNFHTELLEVRDLVVNPVES